MCITDTVQPDVSGGGEAHDDEDQAREQLLLDLPEDLPPDLAAVVPQELAHLHLSRLGCWDASLAQKVQMA